MTSAYKREAVTAMGVVLLGILIAVLASHLITATQGHAVTTTPPAVTTPVVTPTTFCINDGGGFPGSPAHDGYCATPN
jgi:putative Ca2+/H+ antiporter (TMEM165/GDT1 family)